MTSFRFIHASFPDPALSKREIRARLARHRRALLAARKGWERPLDEDGKPDPQKWLDLSDDIRLSLAEQRKIDSRAERISDRHAASTGLQHLRSDDMKKLEVLRHCVRLARVNSEHQADELAASLHAEFPWMGPATEAVWHGMRRSVKAGGPGLRLPSITRQAMLASIVQQRFAGKLREGPKGYFVALRRKTSRPEPCCFGPGKCSSASGHR